MKYIERIKALVLHEFFVLESFSETFQAMEPRNTGVVFCGARLLVCPAAGAAWERGKDFYGRDKVSRHEPG